MSSPISIEASPACSALVPDQPEVSVVYPVFNEEKSLKALVEATIEAMEDTSFSYEIVAVNDGSKDGSLGVLKELCDLYKQLKVVSFRRNEGQTAAMMAGFDFARGEVIVTMDADLQNDPSDIPKLIQVLNEDCVDVVSGWRKHRKDAAFSKKLPSRIANRLISIVSGVELQDYGCSLKAYRREVLEGVRLYGEMHRFIPIYASWMGAKVKEIPVAHHARQHGSSNYGLERIGKVLLDLAVVKFLDRYLVKPIYVFGGFGLFCLLLAVFALGAALVNKFAFGVSLILTPLPLLSAMLVLVGFMSIFMGLLAEILARTYFESQNRRTYSVGTQFNFPIDT